MITNPDSSSNFQYFPSAYYRTGIPDDGEDGNEDNMWEGIRSNEEGSDDIEEKASEVGEVDISDSEKFVNENGREIEQDIIVNELKIFGTIIGKKSNRVWICGQN